MLVCYCKKLITILGLFCGEDAFLAAVEELLDTMTIPRKDGARSCDDEMTVRRKSGRRSGSWRRGCCALFDSSRHSFIPSMLLGILFVRCNATFAFVDAEINTVTHAKMSM